ncbi:MFS transporter [Bifidobacterium platyrrhinorum]|uniref:MFS transporter n=1 Tax=Bifidobacterium platyrrhinorum TaxID=2661628 RepID=A0A6L9STF5_9BIFI|nr:MFS transporter [Bifidobacterium platyrrhinorum]NEG55868.1 MFS transporter [Bifidobacterium platyrrhinorum]
MSASTAIPADERLAAYNANIAAADRNPALSPETGKTMSKTTLFRFGAGFLVFGLLWMSGLAIVSAVLLTKHLQSIFGPDVEGLTGVINACTAVASLVSNLLFGTLSDRSRSKWGRRTPFIVLGAILGGATLFLTGMVTNAAAITVIYCLCMFGLNAMIAPLVAMISDRIPMNVRGTMSAFFGAGQTCGAPIGTLIGSAFILNPFPGFILAGVLMFLGGVVAVIIVPKESSADFLPKDEGKATDVLKSFIPPKFSTAHDFYKAFAGRLCMLLSYQMITVYQLLIFQKYIGLDDKAAGAAMATMSLITMIVSLGGSVVADPISDVIGRRKLPVVAASVLFAIGMAMPWIMPTTMGMFLYAGIAGLGYGVYSSVDQALNVDVLPNKEEAGKDLGVLNLATTLGQMLGPVLMSVITITLGYAAAFPISIVFALLGCVFIMMIKGVK